MLQNRRFLVVTRHQIGEGDLPFDHLEVELFQNVADFHNQLRHTLLNKRIRSDAHW